VHRFTYREGIERWPVEDIDLGATFARRRGRRATSSATLARLASKSCVHARHSICIAKVARETLDRKNVVACNSQKTAKTDSTLGCSQAVPHPSTHRALCRLTSEVRRDPVYSTRYGRRRTKFSFWHCLRRLCKQLTVHVHVHVCMCACVHVCMCMRTCARTCACER
jgi:hypothetical protein